MQETSNFSLPTIFQRYPFPSPSAESLLNSSYGGSLGFKTSINSVIGKNLVINVDETFPNKIY